MYSLENEGKFDFENLGLICNNEDFRQLVSKIELNRRERIGFFGDRQYHVEISNKPFENPIITSRFNRKQIFRPTLTYENNSIIFGQLLFLDFDFSKEINFFKEFKEYPNISLLTTTNDKIALPFTSFVEYNELYDYCNLAKKKLRPIVLERKNIEEAIFYIGSDSKSNLKRMVWRRNKKINFSENHSTIKVLKDLEITLEKYDKINLPQTLNDKVEELRYTVLDTMEKTLKLTYLNRILSIRSKEEKVRSILSDLDSTLEGYIEANQ